MFNHIRIPNRVTVSAIVLSTIAILTTSVSAEAIPAAELERESEVDFGQEVLPILRKNCLACHNETESEGDIVLESAASILKGGSSGPGVVAGNVAESYLFTLASHADEPIMPPEDNEVGAKNLTPQELGIIKLWIEQGAKAGNVQSAEQLTWQSLPATINPVLAVSTSQDGSLIAVGRANQIFMHHGSSGLAFGMLTDPALTTETDAKSHLDMVQSLEFSPDNQWLVSGGYRTAKIWKRSESLLRSIAIESGITSIAPTSQKDIVLLGEQHVEVTESDSATGVTGSTKFPIATPIAANVTIDRVNVIAVNNASLIVFDRMSHQPIGSVAYPGSDIACLNDRRVVFGVESEIHVSDIVLSDATLADDAGDTSVSLRETSQLSGHAGRVTSLATAGDYVVSGSADNTVRVWSISQNKQLRQLDAGTPVRFVAFNQTANRVVAATESGEIRGWSLSDGKTVGSFKSDLRMLTQLKSAQLRRDVAIRQVNNAKADADNAKKRLGQEEENLKKSESNKAKAEEAKKKKQEETGTAKSELAKAEKTLADLKTNLDTAKATFADAAKTSAAARRTYDQHLAALAKAQVAYETANAKLAEGNAVLAAANSKLAADKDNMELKQQADAAKGAVEKLNQNVKQVDAARSNALAKVNESDAARKASEAAVQKSNAEIEVLTKEMDSAQKAVADKKKVVTTRERELTDAVKTLETATASIEQAKRAIERANLTVGQSEQALAAANEFAAKRETAFKAIETSANAFRFKPIGLALSADGNQIAMLNSDGAIHVLASKNVSPIQVIPTMAMSVTFIGNHRLAAVTKNESLEMLQSTPAWELAHTIGTPDANSMLSDRVTAVAISPDSQTLAIGGGEPSRGGELKLFRLSDGQLIRDLPEAHSDTVYSIAFSPNGKFIATGAADRFMKVFEIATGSLVRNFEGHTHHVLSVSWQADARVLATAGADKVVKLWNMKDGSQLKTIQGFGKEVTALQHYGPNDQFVAVCGDQSIYRCNQSGARDGIGRAGDFLYTVSSSEDGKTVAYGGHDSIVRVIDSEGKAVTELRPPSKN